MLPKCKPRGSTKAKVRTSASGESQCLAARMEDLVSKPGPRSPAAERWARLRRIHTGIRTFSLVVSLSMSMPSAFAQTSISIAMRSAARVDGTHHTLPATANGLAIGVSTPIAGRLGAYTTWTMWPENIGQTVAFGGQYSLARAGWKLRPGIRLGTWRKPEAGAPWELIFGGGASFGIGGRWLGSVALGVITIRSSRLTYVVPQAGVAYTLP